MPAVVRLLLPVIAALVIVVQSVTAWAAIEVSGGPSCCCPDPRTCECFDHDGDHDHDAPQLKRCVRDPVQAIMPVQLPAVLPAPLPVLVAPRALVAPILPTPAMPDGRSDRPEKPPS